jgi:P-type Cu2+ transporter
MNVIQSNDSSSGFIQDPTSFVVQDQPGISTLHLMVQNVHCAGCIGKIERSLKATPGVINARVNMSTSRLKVDWQDGAVDGGDLMNQVTELGYPAAPFDPAQFLSGSSKEGRALLFAMAVAGFAAGNVMLLSVSVWAGAFSDMGPVTRDLFHWLSAMIALPAIAFAGRPFFKSAFSALKARSMNMDVPISLAVILASGLSLQQTILGNEHAYFDAAVTLLFFLLVGRYLDHRARAKARSAAEHLLTLSATSANVLGDNGTVETLPIAEIEIDMVVIVAAGERIPVDGVLSQGQSEIDTSLVTGESIPRLTAVGAEVFAGTLNLGAPMQIKVRAIAQDTLLAEIVRLMEAAEQGRTKYVRIADRVARIYAPAVHILAAGTFMGWWAVMGADWQMALITSIAVLIITCPCALGLAVPVVQVVANGMLLQKGVLVKNADALERLAAIDTIVFDKTGTLTRGQPQLLNRPSYDPGGLQMAASIAHHSRHPISQALVAAVKINSEIDLKDIMETAGAGLEAVLDGKRIRLGNRHWCGVEQVEAKTEASQTELWLVRDGKEPIRFGFADQIRSHAKDVIGELQTLGFEVELLSGDRSGAVHDAAKAVGISEWRAECRPEEKVARLEVLSGQGRKVLMVGDGLNDAPALAAGFASMSPSQASDISQTAADLIYQSDKLHSVVTAVKIARLANRLVKQNFGLAFAYNAIAVPIAIAGFATPLVAAIAMSSSSIIVTLNAFRLRLLR